MRGVVTGREVFLHGWTILRGFGPAAYGRCLRALVTGRPKTFLEAVQAPAPHVRLGRTRLLLAGALAASALVPAVLEGHAIVPHPCESCVARPTACP